MSSMWNTDKAGAGWLTVSGSDSGGDVEIAYDIYVFPQLKHVLFLGNGAPKVRTKLQRLANINPQHVRIVGEQVSDPQAAGALRMAYALTDADTKISCVVASDPEMSDVNLRLLRQIGASIRLG